jgi:hypothetical protein
VEALIKAGAFDSLQLNRAALAAIDLGFEFAAAHEANLNQGGLFDMLDDSRLQHAGARAAAVMPWGVKERLSFEKTAIGFYLSGHLFDDASARCAVCAPPAGRAGRQPRAATAGRHRQRLARHQRPARQAGAVQAGRQERRAGRARRRGADRRAPPPAQGRRADHRAGQGQPDRFSGGLR